MQSFTYHMPVETVFGAGRIAELGERMHPTWKRVLIVSDKGISENTDHVDRVRASLKDGKALLFDAVEENPSFETLEQGSAWSRDLGIDVVIGLGGGSPMDAAKGIALLARNSGTMKSYMDGEPLENDPLPVICIPTTSGTGSEVTPFAIFTDQQEGSKRGYAHNGIFPSLSIIDPELTYTMPEKVVRDTGMDALTHAMEAYLSLDTFPMNDLLAVDAIRLCVENLEPAVQKDKNAMGEMACAAMFAGAAIAHASTILLHIMGYPLTVFHNVPHGRANAALLPSFMSFMKTKSTVREKVEYLETLFESKGGIDAFVRSMGIATRLSDYGVEESELENFVKKVIVKGDVKITPAEITEEVILELYRSTL